MASLGNSGQGKAAVWDGQALLLKTGARLTTMSYRADGLRTEKQQPAGTSRFVWDGQALLLKTGAGGATEVQYTLEPGSFGSLVSQRREGASRFHLFDALNSTRQLIDAAQQVTDSYVYRAYGSLAAASGDSETPFRFVGQLGYFYDATLLHYYIRVRHYRPALARWLSVDPLGFLGTGDAPDNTGSQLMYYRNRMYHAELGRFVSRDPIGYEAGDGNLHRYVGNTPVTATDPTGEEPVMPGPNPDPVPPVIAPPELTQDPWITHFPLSTSFCCEGFSGCQECFSLKAEPFVLFVPGVLPDKGGVHPIEFPGHGQDEEIVEDILNVLPPEIQRLLENAIEPGGGVYLNPDGTWQMHFDIKCDEFKLRIEHEY